MSIRIRKSAGGVIAVCAARSVPMPDDIYLDVVRERILLVLQESHAPDTAQLRIAHAGLPSGMGIAITVGDLRQALQARAPLVERRARGQAQ